MLTFKLIYGLFLLFINVSYCQRRITDGEVVAGGKKYVVYLLKASVSPQYYESWLCGGALVSADYIVTSAACVTDVQHLYAVAGYMNYVSDEDIHNDACTKEKKKKIILTCTPKAYELIYEEIEKWSYIDIAVVKVESPYDFNDESYAKVCSYVPVPITINYERKYQEPGIDAIVFGWGHLEKWRQQGDLLNYNEKVMRSAPTLIQDKEECKKDYAVYPGMDAVIDRYMLCTFEMGNINSLGETILAAPATAEGCDVKPVKLKGYEGVSCESINNKPGEEIVLIENSRKDTRGLNETVQYSNKTSNNSLIAKLQRNVVDSKITRNNTKTQNDLQRNVTSANRRTPSRRYGICQNDHGGPLITWVGSHEVLIGVASVFKIKEDFSCTGPYLYASTQCNGAFLDCILKSDPSKTPEMRRAICDSPPSEKGFELIEKHISWIDHPDGPADNERNITSADNTTQITVNQNDTKNNETKLEKHLNETTNLTNTTTTIIHNETISTTTAEPINNNVTKVITRTRNKTQTTSAYPTTTIKNDNIIVKVLKNETKVAKTIENNTTVVTN